jgi:hypothetical protein
MAAVSDAYASAHAGFTLATIFAFLLLVGLVINFVVDPARRRLASSDRTEYASTPGS